MTWFTGSDLLDAGVDVITIALWSGHSPSEILTLRFPAVCIRPLLNKQFKGAQY